VRLTIDAISDAVVEVLDPSGERPGAEEHEAVIINACDDRVADRVVRALASIHLGISEAETGYTEADATLIRAGFNIGRLADGSHAWMRATQPWVAIITNETLTGLPATPREPACAMVVGPAGKKVSFVADDLAAALTVIDQGLLSRAYNPLADVVITGFRGVGRTLH